MIIPMLAAKTDGTDLTYPLLASPKLDGIRCLVIDGIALSRSLKPISNKHVQKQIGKAAYNGLDGELIVGAPGAEDVFNVTQSGIMTIDGEPDFMFHVFDDFSIPNLAFRTRLVQAHKIAGKLAFAAPVHHLVVHDQRELIEYEGNVLRLGYEGVMLRSLDGDYKFGRSTLKQQWLLKLKRFEDSEALIIGVVEKMTNTNEQTKDKLGHSVRSSKKGGMVPAGTMGALRVRDIKTKVEFEIGTGFTDAQRAWFWTNRRQVVENKELMKYRFQPTGVKDKPRFPSALGLRSKLDL